MAIAQSSSAGSLRIEAKAGDTWFCPGAAIFAMLFSIAAFGPSLVYREERSGPPTALLMAHGTVFFAWLAIFFLQTMLVRTHRLSLHRRIGMLSAIVAVAMIVLGYQTAIAMARRGFDLSGDLGIRSDPLAGIAFPLLDIFLFAVLYVAAYLYRRRAAIHKRLMLLAVFGALMPAPITHLLGHYEFLRNKPWMAPLLVGAFLAACAIHDRIVLRRIHPVSLWAALAIFIVDNLWFAVVMPSAAWHAFASKLVG